MVRWTSASRFPPYRNFIKYDDGDEKWYDLSKSRDGSDHVFVDAAEKNTWVLVGRKIKVFAQKNLTQIWREGIIKAYMRYDSPTVGPHAVYKAGQHRVFFTDVYGLSRENVTAYLTLSEMKYKLI